ncbi:unnamed protein product [Gulo gulo]|uniref:Uncharacterized protein n=1 Tax=Gulo gulo TaxID=48420 RepID=A0A9X9LF77_GULGU|nr:unnamed protein product [Gulo gulo]
MRVGDVLGDNPNACSFQTVQTPRGEGYALYIELCFQLFCRLGVFQNAMYSGGRNLSPGRRLSPQSRILPSREEGWTKKTKVKAGSLSC